MRAPPLPTDPEPFHSCLHAGHCLFSRASWSKWDVRCWGSSHCPVDIVTHPLPVSFGAELSDSPSHAWISHCPLPYCSAPAPLLFSSEAARSREVPRPPPLAFPGPEGAKKGNLCLSPRQARVGVERLIKAFNKQLTQEMSPLAGLELPPPSGVPGRERLSGWAEWVHTVGWGLFPPPLNTNE